MRYPLNAVGRGFPGQPVVSSRWQKYAPTLILLPRHTDNRSLLQGKTASLQGGLQPKGTTLDFDGTDDYADLGSDLLAADGAHTVLAVATLRTFNVQYPVLFNYLTAGSGGRRKLFFSKYTDTGYADITFGLHGDSGTGTAGWSLTPGEASGGSSVLNVEHSMVVRCAGITTADYEMWRNGQHLSRAGLAQATNTQTGLNCVGRSSTNDATNHLDGRVSLLVVFNAILPFAACAELSKNPWSIFQAPTRRIFIPASGGGGVSGTLAVTLLNDALSSSGTTTVLGTISRTLLSDSLAASGTTTVISTLARTLNNDVLVASGSVGGISGTISRTLNNDVLAAAGNTTVLGTISRSLNNDILAASGNTTILGTVSRTLNNDVMSATGFPGTAPSVTTYRPLTGVGT